MTQIYDRRTGRRLAELDPQSYRQLRRFLEDQSFDDDVYGLDSERIERFASAGASSELIRLLEQSLAGDEQMDIGLRAD